MLYPKDVGVGVGGVLHCVVITYLGPNSLKLRKCVVP